MRRAFFAVLTMLLCLLTACGGKETDALQAPMDFRAELLAQNGCCFTAQITADYGERVWQYTLRCAASPEGTASFEVLAPEAIAGVTAGIDGADGRLRFDGAYVDFGLMADGELSPIAAPLTVFSCWAEQYIASAGGGCVRYESGFGAKQLEVVTLFDEDNLPVKAEIYQQGTLLMTLDISDFSYTGQRDRNGTTQTNLGGDPPGKSPA